MRPAGVWSRRRIPNFYGCTYSGTCVSGVTIPATGNHFIYQAQPTPTVTAATVTGLVNSDTPADARSSGHYPAHPRRWDTSSIHDPRFQSEA